MTSRWLLLNLGFLDLRSQLYLSMGGGIHVSQTFLVSFVYKGKISVVNINFIVSVFSMFPLRLFGPVVSLTNTLFHHSLTKSSKSTSATASRQTARQSRTQDNVTFRWQQQLVKASLMQYSYKLFQILQFECNSMKILHQYTQYI